MARTKKAKVLNVPDAPLDRLIAGIKDADIPVAVVRAKRGRKAGTKMAKKAKTAASKAPKTMSVAAAKRLMNAKRGRGRPSADMHAKLQLARKILGIKKGGKLAKVAKKAAKKPGRPAKASKPAKAKKPVGRAKIAQVSKAELAKLVKRVIKDLMCK